MTKILARDGSIVVNGEKPVASSRCLPETITVTLSGFAGAFPDRSEISLSFESCFGSGAAGHVSAPPPDEAAGAVSDPIITDGGSGYAVIGRIEPNIKLTVVGPGSGAELTPVITESVDSCDRPVWVVNSVTVDAAGSEYDETTTIDVQVGNFPEYKATADSVTGTGARLRVAWVGGTNWTVSGVEIIAAGTGYTVGDTFTVGAGVTLTVATVGGSGQILSLTHNQTETYPVLDSFGSPAFTVELPRSEPTLELEDNGSGAVLTVNLGVLSAAPASWQITSVTVVNGGSDDYYTDGNYILVAEDPAVHGEGSEVLIVRTNRSEPVYELSGGNNDATLTPSYTSNGYPAPNNTWYMDSVAVGAGGTGYADEEYLTVSPSDPYRDVDLSTPSVKVRTVRAEPAVFLAPASVTGSGASISLTMTQGTDFEGRDSWSVTGTSIDSAGTGYTVGDTFTIDTSNGNAISSGTVEVASVDTGGEILTVSITDGGEYWLDTGIVDEAVVDWPGEGYHDDGSIHSIEVADGGEFWEIGNTIDSVTVDDAGESYTEDPAEPPIVADVTVSLTGGGGSGADIDVTINDDTGSPLFGRIEGATLNTGGAGYTGAVWVKKCCGEFYDGKVIVLQKGEKCVAPDSNTSEPSPDARMAPTVAVTPDVVNGTGAVLRANLNTGDSGVARLWYATSISILTHGVDYQVGDTFDITATDGVTVEAGRFEVTGVDGTGGITTLAAVTVGEFYKDDPNVDVSPNNAKCRFEHRHCTYNSVGSYRDRIHVQYRSEEEPPLVIITDTNAKSSDDTTANANCSVTMTSTTLVAHGDPFEFTANSPGGATAVVTEGGEYDINDDYYGGCSCAACCKGADAPPEELTVSWSRTVSETHGIATPRWYEQLPPSGDYVLTASGQCHNSRGGEFAWDTPAGYEVLRPGRALISLQARRCREWSGQDVSVSVVTGPGTETGDLMHETLRCNSCEKCRLTPTISTDFIADGHGMPTILQSSCADVCVDDAGCFAGRSWDFYAWVRDWSDEDGENYWTKVGTLTVP